MVLAESAPRVQSRAGRVGNFLLEKVSKVERNGKDIPRGRKSVENGKRRGQVGPPAPGLFPCLTEASLRVLWCWVLFLPFLHRISYSCPVIYARPEGGQPGNSRSAEKALGWGERKNWLS